MVIDSRGLNADTSTSSRCRAAEASHGRTCPRCGDRRLADWANATADPEARAALSDELADIHRALGDRSEADRLAAEARAFGWAVPPVDRELAAAARAEKVRPLLEAGDLDGAVAALHAATGWARTSEVVPVLRAVLQVGRGDLLPSLAMIAGARPKKPATGDYAWALAEADRCARMAVGSPDAAARVLSEALALADNAHTAEIAWIAAIRGLTELRDAALAQLPAGPARARVYIGAFDHGASAGAPESAWLERAESELTRPEYVTIERRAELLERWAAVDPARLPAALRAAYGMAGLAGPQLEPAAPKRRRDRACRPRGLIAAARSGQHPRARQ